MDKVKYSDGCWIWAGAKTGAGYGSVKIRGHVYPAHRVSFEHFVGPVLEGLVVCHSCDVKLCVNPGHLWSGAQWENMRDMREKGRSRPQNGVRNNNASLTEEDIRAIRASAERQVDLAARYGVSPANISMIRTRMRWSHVA
jgi:uncharacterized NAD-dependent epimerase/dehydratase family protein